MELLAAPGTFAAILAIVFFAAVVQAGLGMGFGIAAAPLLALLDPELVPATTMILGLASTVWVAVIHRRLIVWQEVGIATLGRFAGVAVSGIVLVWASRDAFTAAFAIFILIAVAMSALGLRLRFTAPLLAAVAVLSGVMGTITSVGAPPMALIYQDRPPEAARATLAAFFSIGVAMSLAMLIVTGWCGLRDFQYAALMAPAMVAGLLAAGRIRGAFDRRFRPILLAVSGVAGVILLGRVLWA